MRYQIVLEARALTGEKELDSDGVLASRPRRGFWMGKDGTLCVPAKTLRSLFRNGGRELGWQKGRFYPARVVEHEVSVGYPEPHRVMRIGGYKEPVEVVEDVMLLFHMEADLTLEKMQAAWSAAGKHGFGAARLPFTAAVTAAAE